MEEEPISFIRQIWMNNFNGQLLVGIPKDIGLRNNDFVLIKKALPTMVYSTCQVCKKEYNKHTLKELSDHGLYGVK
jgi:hypothetical protein